MNRFRMQRSPRSWSPKLNPTVVRLLRPFQRRKRVREENLVDIRVLGADVVRDALAAGCGVLITPNHATHADSYCVYESAYQVGQPYYIMAMWQVFATNGFIARWVLRRHGVFSIDREGKDMAAFKLAVSILQERKNPLVIFPEGEVYHCSERVTPFREGAAMIAVAAAKRAKRPVVCVPTAIRFQYVDDPTPQLEQLMDELEQRIFWRPQHQLPLERRIYKFAEAILALKETEFLGRAGSGELPQRIDELANEILRGLEDQLNVKSCDGTIPERVKEVRRLTIEMIDETAADNAPERERLDQILDEVFLVTQLFSYPGDYVAERPSIERLAETLDKFEEDVLEKFTASIRGSRRAVIRFDEPVLVEPSRDRRAAARKLTDTLESRIQSMLDEQREDAG
ncbi:MAG: 1-acyl-sn-glycerol-3-phosphate acyltransferase [Planctomycetes bacterium]|nr:1-acyl-sn-glycerol-3-phosphate acyltransferase [Planctomycetota bacterium]